MKVILGGRGCGKTTALIKLADGNNGYIVCQYRRDVYRIMECAKEIGCTINSPITFYEFVEREYYGKGVRKFFVDNADLLIQYLTDVSVEAITITGK